jgi:hypothetical protein
MMQLNGTNPLRKMKVLALTAVSLSALQLSFAQEPISTNAIPSDAEIRKLIIGTWGGERAGSDRHGSVTFAANGTQTATNWVMGNAVLNAVSYAESTWRIENGTLFTKVTKTTDERLCPLGSNWRGTIISINATNIAVVTQFGTTNSLARVN